MEAIITHAAKTGSPPAVNHVTLDQKVDVLWILLSTVCDHMVNDPVTLRVYQAARQVMAIPTRKA